MKSRHHSRPGSRHGPVERRENTVPCRVRWLRAGLLATVIAGCAILSIGIETRAEAPAPIVGKLVDPVLLRGIEDVHIDDDHVYLPCREGKRLTICSIEDPRAPTIITSFTHAELGPVCGFAKNGNTLYLVSQSNSRLLVVDAADKSNLRLLGSVPVGNGVLYKVAYREGHCYVAGQSEKKLFVVDVRNPSQPSVVGSTAVTTDEDGPFSVLLRGDYALLGTIFGPRNRLAVVDIGNPATPRLVNQIFDPVMGHTSGEVVGDLFFAVNWDANAFLVINLADTANPKLAAKLVDKRLGKPNRCVVRGNRAYLPMVEGHGVAVVDIADPLNPRFLNAYHNPVLKKTYGAAVHGEYLVVGAREGNSLLVLDRMRLAGKEE